MGEGLFDGVGKAIANMPPTLAALVIMGLAVAGLVYAWRRSGEEAKRERVRADQAEADGLHGKLDAISADVSEIKTGIEILKDRMR